jgi:hypothetical protein
MGYLLNEKKMINDNIFLYEERLNSQLSRFLEKSPTFVTYYHINDNESTVDLGFQNIERILGPNSPVRFNEIKDFPIYGIDQIILSLSDELQGVDSSYEGEAIILPNTITPYPNDMFTVNYLDQNYLFMITEVAYDTIKSNNYYKITFTVKSMEQQDKNYLLNQTNDKFHCILDNIGTKEKAIIKSDDLDQLILLNEIYKNIAEYFKVLFFNARYNSFLIRDLENNKIYDKYMTEFINKFELFNEKKNYSTLLLVNEDKSQSLYLEYHNSIYRAIELCDKNLLTNYVYSLVYVSNQYSVFNFYRDRNVRSIILGKGDTPYIRTQIIDNIKNAVIDDNENVCVNTIVKFFDKKINTVYDLDREKLKDYMSFMSYDFETFILTPILLYILKYSYNKFMSTT